MVKSSTRAVFLDRDGVINKDFGYVHTIEQFEFQDGIVEFLLTLKYNGFLLFIVTNQSGIGRELYSEEDYIELTNLYQEILKKQNIEIEEIVHCPHAPQDACDCRKPKPKMVIDLIQKYNLNPKECFLIGNKQSDLQTATSAGIQGFIKSNQIDFESILEKIFNQIDFKSIL